MKRLTSSTASTADPSEHTVSSPSRRRVFEKNPPTPAERALALLQRYKVPIPDDVHDTRHCVVRFISHLEMSAEQCRHLAIYLHRHRIPADIDLFCGIQALAPRFLPLLDLEAAPPADSSGVSAQAHNIGLLRQAQERRLFCSVAVTDTLPLEVAQALNEAMVAEHSVIMIFVYQGKQLPSDQAVEGHLRAALKNSTSLHSVHGYPDVVYLMDRGVETLELWPEKDLPAERHLRHMKSLKGIQTLRLVSDLPHWHLRVVNWLDWCCTWMAPQVRVRSLLLTSWKASGIGIDRVALIPLLRNLFTAPGMTHVGLPDLMWLQVLEPKEFLGWIREQGLQYLKIAPHVQRHFDRQPQSDAKDKVQSMLDLAGPVLQTNRLELQARLNPHLDAHAPNFWSMATAQFQGNPDVGRGLQSGHPPDLTYFKQAIKDPATASALGRLGKASLLATQQAGKPIAHPATQASEPTTDPEGSV